MDRKSKRSKPQKDRKESISHNDPSARDHRDGAISSILHNVAPSSTDNRVANRQEVPIPRWKKVAEIVALSTAVLLLFVNVIMAIANWRAAKAARDSAETAKDTLIAEDRPWLTADVRIAGPLVFDKTGAVSVPVWFAVKNSGHSPAINAWAFPELFLPRNTETEPNIEREKFCSSVTRMTNGSGQAIFPSGSAPDSAGIVSTAVAGNVVRQASVDGFINPTIILCIAYQTTLEGKWHHTGMIFDVSQMMNGERLAIKVGQNVPQQQLGVSVSIFHGVTAD